jgi:(p)ppGpp synthase/HD superfamily hydrolase
MTEMKNVEELFGNQIAKGYPQIKQTLSLIKIAHNGQLYNNQPYWHHPVRVMLRLNWTEVTPDDISAALLHDTYEDTAITEEDLGHFGYSNRVRYMVKTLTRDSENETYKMYIERIVDTDDLSIMRIKLADLYENSNNVRFLPPEKRGVMVRYGKSIRDVTAGMKSNINASLGIRMLEQTNSGELNGAEIGYWIGEQPKFL